MKRGKLTNEALDELYYCEGQFTNVGDQRSPSPFIWSLSEVATKKYGLIYRVKPGLGWANLSIAQKTYKSGYLSA